MQQNMKCKAD